MKVVAALPRRAVISAAVAAAIAIVVTVLVLAFGVIRVPSFPALTPPGPGLTGFVAYERIEREAKDEDPGRECIDVVPAAGGRPRTVHCDEGRFSTRILWTREGRLAVLATLADSRQELLLVDPADGRVAQRVPGVSHSRFTGEGSSGRRELRTDHDGTRVRVQRVENGAVSTLISVRAPDQYRFRTVSYSPDRSHLLVTDSEGRLLVADADGSDVRVLVRRHENSYERPLWFQPGRAEGTVTFEELVGRRR